jgi:hypothetical protein
MNMPTALDPDKHATASDQGGPAPSGDDGGAAPEPVAAKSSAPPSSAPETTDDWTICCSGGGIRSATYCLGGLQSLDEGGLLHKAKWIIGISGGSYIAASRALVAHNLNRADGVPSAYARGTAEEDNLRNNTHYIAPDAKTVLVGVLSLVLGAIVTFILALAPLYALGHAWGWLLREQGVLIWPPGSKASASIAAWAWWRLVPAIAAGVTLLLFFFWWITLASGSPGRGARRARLVGWAAAITTGIAVLMLAVPPVIAWLYHSTGALGDVVHFFGFGKPGNWSLATLGGLITAVVAVARSSQKQLAKLSTPAAATGSSSGFFGQLATWARSKLTPWLASIVIIGVGAFATLLWIGNAARVGYSPAQLWAVLIAVGIVLLTRVLVDINRTSLHDVYRWRLADAYAVTREAAKATQADTRQRLFAEAAATRLSQLRNQDGPGLVIATTANINADRTVPPGRGGFCLAFDPEKVSLRGDPSCGEQDVEVDTTDYEHLLGHTRFTLFDIVAISGAAFSPLMGSATRSASRIMLTLTNLRLGVWMPHPTVVRQARAYLDYPDKHLPDRRWTKRTWLLLLWYVLPNLSWGQDSTKQKPEQQAAQQKKRALSDQREAQLWAHVLKLRSNSGRDARVRDRLQAAVCWRVMQPTMGLLWAEAAGHTSYRATWINVTDGGHYDNLGLVEALRRGAKNIVALDASGDSPHTWFTLGGAMRLARADAEVDIALDPTTMIHGDGHGAAPTLVKSQVVRPWAHGTFTRQPHQTVHDHHAPGGLQTANGHQAANGQQAANGPAAGSPQSGNGHQPADSQGADHRQPAEGSHAENGHQTEDHCQPANGNIWVCKLGWWNGAPWDIRAYAAGHSTYPCDPTMQQLYDGAEFDAYHELGSCSVVAAATDGRLPLLLPPR